MLGAKTIHDCRPAACHVADHSTSGALGECAHESRGEAVRIGREGTLELYAGDLPVASGAVLPRRMWHHEAPCPDRLAHGRHPRERRDVAQAGALQVGKLQSAHGPRNIAERVAAGVAVRLRVRRGTDTDAVEDENDCAFAHRCSSGEPSATNRRGSRERNPVSNS